ncbi:MAG: DUF3341 domain-containing protein [Verrucomicrobia bacterium]|nr:DUF3341 domain-containing protein [Verrucomicrobiota bacterium]
MAASSYGLIATFETPAALYHAAEKVRDAGYKNWDCITPFPVHGLDKAMGLRRSIVPRISLAGGITGFCTGMTMIWWTGAVDYTLTVGGKPLFSPMFAFPISYELTILFTAFATIGGMFFLNGLPMHYHPVLKYDQIKRGMDDTFFIVIEARDPRFNLANTRTLLEQAGGTEVKELEA